MRISCFFQTPDTSSLFLALCDEESGWQAYIFYSKLEVLEVLKRVTHDPRRVDIIRLLGNSAMPAVASQKTVVIEAASLSNLVASLELCEQYASGGLDLTRDVNGGGGELISMSFWVHDGVPDGNFVYRDLEGEYHVFFFDTKLHALQHLEENLPWLDREMAPSIVSFLSVIEDMKIDAMGYEAASVPRWQPVHIIGEIASVFALAFAVLKNPSLPRLVVNDLFPSRKP